VTTVFISGSRRASRLNAEVRHRLDRIIDRGLRVLVGDANGADKAFQTYLASRGYRNVEVFCTEGICRNNIGGWRTRGVPAPEAHSGFEYYSAKDAEMAREASVGLMLWDGRSRGTLANISRLLDAHKKAVVYLLPEKRFLTLRGESDLDGLISSCRKHATGPRRSSGRTPSADLF
jgi:hypothetical protein